MVKFTLEYFFNVFIGGYFGYSFMTFLIDWNTNRLSKKEKNDRNN